MGGAERVDPAETAALMGVTEAEAAVILAALGEAPEPEELRLAEDCRDAVRLFAAASGQWRTAGMAGAVLGLDFGAVDAMARWLGLAPSPGLLADLRVMEDEALKMIRSKS